MKYHYIDFWYQDQDWKQSQASVQPITFLMMQFQILYFKPSIHLDFSKHAANSLYKTHPWMEKLSMPFL